MVIYTILNEKKENELGVIQNLSTQKQKILNIFYNLTSEEYEYKDFLHICKTKDKTLAANFSKNINDLMKQELVAILYKPNDESTYVQKTKEFYNAIQEVKCPTLNKPKESITMTKKRATRHIRNDDPNSIDVKIETFIFNHLQKTNETIIRRREITKLVMNFVTDPDFSSNETSELSSTSFEYIIRRYLKYLLKEGYIKLPDNKTTTMGNFIKVKEKFNVEEANGSDTVTPPKNHYEEMKKNDYNTKSFTINLSKEIVKQIEVLAVHNKKTYKEMIEFCLKESVGNHYLDVVQKLSENVDLWKKITPEELANILKR